MGFNEFGLKGFGVEAPCHERTEHGNLETRNQPNLLRPFLESQNQNRFQKSAKVIKRDESGPCPMPLQQRHSNSHSNYSIRATFAAACYSFHSFVPLEAKQEDGERPTRPRPTFKNQPDEHWKMW